MSTICNRLVRFQELKKFTDVAFEFQDGTSVHCHKIHLAAHSVFLKLLFKYNNCDRYPMLKEQFMAIFKWAYEGQAPDDDIIVTLLYADYLGSASLTQHCTTVFTNKTDSFSYGWMLQLTHIQSPLQRCIISHLAGNIKDAFISNTEEFCELPYDVLKAVLQSDSFFIFPESYLWLIIKRWVNHDFDSRKELLEELLPRVKLGLMPSSECRQIRCEVASMCDENESQWCSDLFERVFEIQRWKQGLAVKSNAKVEDILSLVDSYMISPRMPRVCALATGGWSQAAPSREMELYDHKSDFWYKLPITLPSPRAYHDATSFGDQLYMVGGFAGDERFKTIVRLDLRMLQFLDLPPLHRERCFVSVAVTGDKVYCMGGYDGSNESSRLASCEAFDPKTNQWTEIAELTEPRSDAAAASYNGKLYIVGGFNGSRYLETAEVYDPQTNQWTGLPDMQSKRGGVGCCIFKDKLYAIGGCDGQGRLKTVERLDLKVDEPAWTFSESMIQGRSNFGVCSLDDRIIVAGGYVEPATTERIEWFDGFQWYVGANMPRKMSAFVLTSIRMTSELAEALEEERKTVLKEKRRKRLEVLSEMSSNDVKEINNFVEMDSDSRMFDSFPYPK